MEAAFQGEPGAYSELALKKAFPHVKTIACPGFSDAFQLVAERRAPCALLPVENSTEGSVREVNDLLLQHDVVALAEVVMRIRHMLIANPGVRKDGITKVYSHPQALAQCRHYIESNGYEAIHFSNTAAAVKMVMEKGLADAAAIASENAAELYGMRVLDTSIEDRKNNCTRFLLISRREEESSLRPLVEGCCIGPTKTSIMFGLQHEPGSLHKVLGEFGSRGVNLTQIESRPTKEKAWEYLFHVDFEGDASSAGMRRMLDALRRMTTFLKVVGSYRVAYSDER